MQVWHQRIRTTFKKYALNGQEEVAGKDLTEGFSGTVLKTLAATPGSISYLALSYSDDKSIKSLQLYGVAPTADNITVGKYPINCPVLCHRFTFRGALGCAPFSYKEALICNIQNITE